MPALRPAGRTRLDSTTLVEHLDVMYRAALAMSGSAEDAQDIIQDACVKVLSRPRRIEPGRERAYLVTAVRHAWYDRLRARSLRPQAAALEDHEQALASPLPGPAEVADTKRVYEAIA